MIPSNITKEHIIKAIEEISKGEIPKKNQATKYKLKYKNIEFPPKYVISIANKYANGEVLPTTNFSGGPETNDFLKKLNFEVYPKNTNPMTELKTIILNESKVYKIAMSTFLYDTKYKNIDPINHFENNGLIVMSEKTGNSQGEKFKDQLNKGDYVYVSYGYKKLGNLYKVTSDYSIANKKTGLNIEDEWICREVDLVQKSVIDNTFDLKNNYLSWLPSGYTTFAEVKDITEANKILFNSFYNLTFIKSEMRDLKSEFSNWLISNPKVEYFNNNKEKIVEILTEYNSFFEVDVFLCSSENYKSIKKIIYNRLYEESTNDFLTYSSGDGNHRPRAILGKRNYLKFLEETFNPTNIKKGVIKLSDSKNSSPLNQILYGPPGTGKTYNTILKSAEIIENRAITSYDEALNIFKTNLHNRIEFITFHQNYSYEDFIQGLRPETDNKSTLVFEKKDGIFKKIADRALENLRLSEKAPSELTNETQFNKALEKFQDIILDQEDNFKINETAFIFEVEEDAFRYTGEKWTNPANGLRMKFNDLREFYRNNVKSRKDIKKLRTISGLANQHATYYFLVYEQIIKHIPEKIESPQRIEKQNYIIIIDEINRANISRVFGELITLIEPDKRSHGKIPLEAKLPSGDLFMVPSNLYIIGTMNTADKSIALLDIALRRRFDFESMYPKYKINGQEIYEVEILKKINEQIIKSKGHDFQIGHAYFMGNENKDLVKRMNKKVIPLLLEYYMNDKKEVEGILNNAGLKVEKESWPLRITGKND